LTTVLVDTSVWIDHLRKKNTTLVELLETMQVSTHPFVIGELACGSLANRTQFLGLLAAMPHVPPVTHVEVLNFIAARRLMGRGLGWIDMHLLASASLSNLALWTVDKKLSVVTRELGLGVRP
jgi:predicted nucleic acid-binding protein